MKTTYLITVTAPDGEEIMSLRSISGIRADEQFESLKSQIKSSGIYPKGTKVSFNEVQTIESFSYTK